MITGGIDISVGSVVAMVCMMLAWMMERGEYRCVSGHPYCSGHRMYIRPGTGLFEWPTLRYSPLS